MVLVKVTTCAPEWPYLVQSPNGSARWGNCEFRFDDDTSECDWWFVFEDPLTRQSAVCPQDATVLVVHEPAGVRRYPPDYVDQFANVMTCQEYITHDHKHVCPPSGPWHLRGVSYDDLLSSPVKSKTMSAIASNKASIPGHRARLDFVNRLRSELSGSIDIFGRGINELANKWDGLAPYKYSIAIENNLGPNYWTEKVADCFLTETLPIHYGCTNLSDYFPRDSYIQIDITKPDEAIQIIRDIIETDPYDEHLAAVREAKQLVLNKYQLFPLMADFIATHESDSVSARRKHTVLPMSHWESRSIPSRVRTRLRMLGRAVKLLPPPRF